MYVSEICAVGIFVTFPLWLKNMKSRLKIAFFSNQHHFEIWFPKKKTITFFWSKLSKLHKKDPILHVTATFSLKTRGNKNKQCTHSTPLNSHLVGTWFLMGLVSHVQRSVKAHKNRQVHKLKALQCCHAKWRRDLLEWSLSKLINYYWLFHLKSQPPLFLLL